MVRKKRVKKKTKVSSSVKKRKFSKRVLKKSAKRKAVKKRIPKKSPAQVKKDLELFSKGVERLKELKRELASLDTRGFAKEEQSIRSKLQNVSDIPTIERELKILKQKINRKYRPKRRKVSATRKELQELKEEDLPEIKSAIRKLSARVGDSDSMKARVDSGVGAVIDTDFNNFLAGIKVKFSNRVREREKELDELLKKDLAKREEKYKNKQNNLLKDFEDKRKILEEDLQKKYSSKAKSEADKRYAKKLRSELHREVTRNFKEMLNKKIASEKVELGKKYKEELRAHVLMKLQDREDNIKKSFVAKAEELQKRKDSIDKQMKESREKFDEQVKESRGKFEEQVKESRERLEDMKKNLKMSFADKMRNLLKTKESLRLQKEKVAKNAERRKIENAKYLNNLEKELRGKEAETLKNLREKKMNEMKELKQNLSENLHKEMEKNLRSKESILRKQLRKEYDLRLRKHIEERETELKKKRIEMELEMQNKVKQMFH